MTGPRRIDCLFAFILVDEAGTEGVPAMGLSTGEIAPMMGADLARVDQLRRLVQTSPQFAGKRVTIARFGQRETIGEIDRTTEPPT